MSAGARRGLAWAGGALGVALLGFFLLSPLLAPQSTPQAGPTALAGRSAPVFQLRDDTGAPVSLERYRGRIVVLNLWASWCPPCRAEMPELERFSRSPQAHDVAVIGVNQGESAQRAAAFARALQVGFAIWLDPDQRYGRAIGALGLPTTIVVDPRGIVVRGFDGAVTFDQVRAAVALARRSQ